MRAAGADGRCLYVAMPDSGAVSPAKVSCSQINTQLYGENKMILEDLSTRCRQI